MPHAKSKAIAEFGDFQTPAQLADEVCDLLVKTKCRPATVLEPTCGEGSFLKSAQKHFSTATRFVGFDVNTEYVESARLRLPQCDISQASFFDLDWPKLLDELPAPLLVLGNPPWVTNSALGAFGSKNLPAKRNLHADKGLECAHGEEQFRHLRMDACAFVGMAGRTGSDFGDALQNRRRSQSFASCVEKTDRMGIRRDPFHRCAEEFSRFRRCLSFALWFFKNREIAGAGLPDS